ncbi:hypothetical protein H6G17_26830 [Chroococcidiopsis sp. FACHB-1243]|uniref:hypothetical protein n=1 Tax=unclassified Chroococcidiopsis TaxID=2646205 RepID=UPI000B6D3653|nr:MULTISPECIES: hypothetical protein [unclassified Chroococcidiopsis]MBD2309082.1 hypothetical protein [Chroococcidiopsis sp. [FACHB-1243]]OWY65232.1 hypothetical protein B7486_43080 [cyanobacterium TDX16]PSB40476.1 hypothetical protein C7B80_33335 [Cyanosarcina cf. burmensis CCALA 770]
MNDIAMEFVLPLDLVRNSLTGFVARFAVLMMLGWMTDQIRKSEKSIMPVQKAILIAGVLSIASSFTNWR